MNTSTDTLYAQIMNIRADHAKSAEEYSDSRAAYLLGHRDARHAAAELTSALAPSPQQATEPNMRAICEALGFDPTNHHNAAKCPYCRPAEAGQVVDPVGAAPEPVMLSALNSDVKWPHYFGLQVGQRVRTHTGMEGHIAAIRPGGKKYHVLRDPAYGGIYGAWEVTPLPPYLTTQATTKAGPATKAFDVVYDQFLSFVSDGHPCVQNEIESRLEELLALAARDPQTPSLAPSEKLSWSDRRAARREELSQGRDHEQPSTYTPQTRED